MSNVVIPVIVGAVCAVVFAVLGFVLGVAHRRKTAEKEIGSATQEATKIINNALAEAEASKKEKVLEAKDEVHKLRSDADRDIRERRNEVQRQEKRLNQREEYLDKKADSLEAKNDKISEKQKELENKLLEVDGIKKSQFDMLERISGLTQEEAKNQLCKIEVGQVYEAMTTFYPNEKVPPEEKNVIVEDTKMTLPLAFSCKSKKDFLKGGFDIDFCWSANNTRIVGCFWNWNELMIIGGL